MAHRRGAVVTTLTEFLLARIAEDAATGVRVADAIGSPHARVATPWSLWWQSD
ncbi:MAG: hypothetical protein JWM31_3091, partial [Solirubrobacterales bacterium]|nr:hypothetical protein [Solirubrobacterales bacterium]